MHPLDAEADRVAPAPSPCPNVDELRHDLRSRGGLDGGIRDRLEQPPAGALKRMLASDGIDQNRRVQHDHR